MKRCPVHPQDCRDDAQCDHCLNFMNTCDECLEAGHQEAGCWHEAPDGRVLCDRCFVTVVGWDMAGGAE